MHVICRDKEVDMPHYVITYITLKCKLPGILSKDVILYIQKNHEGSV